ncbi:MAG: alcohol dehydrogenase catalytic domain-containing protein, partial [Bacteroidota bacterium]
MKVLEVHPGGLAALQVTERELPQPGPGEVRVRWHATSLNFHDYLVATGGIPVPAGRIPMSDGAGEVVALGQDVYDWEVGDQVMSMFFPNWVEGRPSFLKMAGILGETLDGCMAEYSVLSTKALTRIPRGFSYAEAATLPCAATTAWRGLMVEGQLQAGQSVLIQGS